jgi:hypothetical protein
MRELFNLRVRNALHQPNWLQLLFRLRRSERLRLSHPQSTLPEDGILRGDSPAHPGPFDLTNVSDNATEPETDDAAFEILWSHVLDHWDEEKAHAAFLEHCLGQDQLLPAAKRYRSLSASERHQAEVERRLKGIAALALARMEQTRTTLGGAKRQAGRLVALLFLVAAVTGLLIFYGLR